MEGHHRGERRKTDEGYTRGELQTAVRLAWTTENSDTRERVEGGKH